MSTVTFETKHSFICLFRIILIFLFFLITDKHGIDRTLDRVSSELEFCNNVEFNI